jgi:ADP-ribosylglycohydrolase
MSIDFLDKFKGTLLGVAIGDVLGAPFEGHLRTAIHSRFDSFDEFLKNNKNLFFTHTDDTQLTLHTAEALIEGKGFDIDVFIDEYIKWLDDPPIGAGYGCISSIRKLRQGISWKEASSNSGGNGTAMRVSPIGLFYCEDIDKLISSAIKSSQITHMHPAASAGAVVTAKAVAYLLDKDPEEGFSIDEFFKTIISSISNSKFTIWNEFKDILTKIQSNLDMSIESGLIKFSQAGVKAPFFIEHYLGQAFVHPYTLSTVACAIFVFLKKLASFKECIYELSTAGGDSDTIGAIGGSLAGAYFGMEKIPEDLINIVKINEKIFKISEELFNEFVECY